MKLLLDTHTFLWWITDNSGLSMKARQSISAGSNEIFFSAASGWEIAIKAQRGRLQLPDTPARFISSQLLQNSFQVLQVELPHALHVYHLPDIHRDPFDRLLVAQSQLENLPLLSADPDIRKYDVEVVW